MLRLLFFLLTVSVTLTSSCDRCKNLDCVADDYDAQLRVVSATGKDLVFGSARVYDKNAIKFFSVEGPDTTFFVCRATGFNGAGYDSILQVRFYPEVDTAYMRLSDGDVDTLKISYKTTITRCCGVITEIAGFRFNNGSLIPGDKGPQELRK